jgi:aerobic carbon-monoxide dehydrogenase medium subunit
LQPNKEKGAMKSFVYHKPQSVLEAVALLAGIPDSQLLAGGMTLLPTMKHRLAAPSALIDLAGIAALKDVSVANGTLTIGAMTRHVDVARSELIATSIPALSTLAEAIGDPAVRNRGTIGGALANNDPSADYPAALLALAGTVVTSKREIAADDFFHGPFETALQADELIVAARLPAPIAAGYSKFVSQASRYALVGVFVAKFNRGVRVAVTGAASTVFRLKAFEAALTQRWEPNAIADIAVDASGFNADIHAEAAFRGHLVTVMAKRAVAAALASTRGI